MQEEKDASPEKLFSDYAYIVEAILRARYRSTAPDIKEDLRSAGHEALWKLCLGRKESKSQRSFRSAAYSHIGKYMYYEYARLTLPITGVGNRKLTEILRCVSTVRLEDEEGD